MENKGKRRTIIVLHIKDVYCTLIGCSFSLRNRGSRPKMPIIREMVQNNLQFFLDVLIFTAVIHNKPRIFCTVYGTTAGERERETGLLYCVQFCGDKKNGVHTSDEILSSCRCYCHAKKRLAKRGGNMDNEKDQNLVRK